MHEDGDDEHQDDQRRDAKDSSLAQEDQADGQTNDRLAARDVEVDAEKDGAGGKRHNDWVQAKAGGQHTIEKTAQNADGEAAGNGEGGREAVDFPQPGGYHGSQAGDRRLRQIEGAGYDHERLAHRHD